MNLISKLKSLHKNMQDKLMYKQSIKIMPYILQYLWTKKILSCFDQQVSTSISGDTPAREAWNSNVIQFPNLVKELYPYWNAETGEIANTLLGKRIWTKTSFKIYRPLFTVTFHLEKNLFRIHNESTFCSKIIEIKISSSALISQHLVPESYGTKPFRLHLYHIISVKKK